MRGEQSNRPACHQLCNSVLAGFVPCAPMWELWKCGHPGTPPDRSLAATQAAFPVVPGLLADCRRGFALFSNQPNSALSQLTTIALYRPGPLHITCERESFIITLQPAHGLRLIHQVPTRDPPGDKSVKEQRQPTTTCAEHKDSIVRVTSAENTLSARPFSSKDRPGRIRQTLPDETLSAQTTISRSHHQQRRPRFVDSISSLHYWHRSLEQPRHLI